MPTLTPDASSASTQMAELNFQRARRADLRRKRDSPDRGTASQQLAGLSWFALKQRAQSEATRRAGGQMYSDELNRELTYSDILPRIGRGG
jgi:hypothetical protein